MNAAERLQRLRERMDAERTPDGRPLGAYLVPSADAHQSEYTPERWARCAFLTGFDGSAGDAVVTTTEARLWTDGRYWTQAAGQLDAAHWTLVRSGERGVPTLHEWLTSLDRAVVGVDPRVISARAFDDLDAALRRRGSVLRAVERNLVDEVWSGAPPMPRSAVREHPPEFAGRTAADKLADLRSAMAAKSADAHVVASLDAVAWLFNLRAADVPYNPVFLAYAIVTTNDAALYTDVSRIADEARRSLRGGVRLEPYERFESDLRALAPRHRWWIDEVATSAHIAALIGDASRIVERSRSPVVLAKARKNEAELRAMRDVHERDGAAMVRFLRWFLEAAPAGGLTESSVADRIAAIRAGDARWLGPAFASIVGEGPNGAVMHYRPRPGADRAIRADSHVLIDSGGQYVDGTTDITRTLSLGAPTPEQRDRATRVLKGMIAVSRLRFPKGTTGLQLDAFARQHLWSVGLDYAHGTGHGVGAALSVHEWPPSLSHRPIANHPFEPGMTLSNEPGFYAPDRFGVRIENLIEVVEDQQHPGFLRFETLTLCPIQAALIDPSMLTTDEQDWLDTYHTRVRETLSPRLAGADLEFLRRSTRSLRDQSS